MPPNIIPSIQLSISRVIEACATLHNPFWGEKFRSSITEVPTLGLSWIEADL